MADGAGGSGSEASCKEIYRCSGCCGSRCWSRNSILRHVHSQRWCRRVSYTHRREDLFQCGEGTCWPNYPKQSRLGVTFHTGLCVPGRHWSDSGRSALRWNAGCNGPDGSGGRAQRPGLTRILGGRDVPSKLGKRFSGIHQCCKDSYAVRRCPRAGHPGFTLSGNGAPQGLTRHYRRQVRGHPRVDSGAMRSAEIG